MAQVGLTHPVLQVKGARNLFLDVLRGLLAWVIVLVHWAWFCGVQHSGTRAAIGEWSVQVFMILAGYVALASYRAEPYPRYLQKRFWRIVPVLAVCWALCLPLGTALEPAWFITLLIQFYLIFPGLMWLVKQYGSTRVLGLCLLIGLFGRLPVFYGWGERFCGHGELLPMNFIWFVLGMCAFHLVDQLALEELSEGSRSFPLLITAGKISYSTYLVHWPILFALDRILRSLNPLIHAAGLLLLGLPLVALASVIVHHWVELPAIAVGSRRGNYGPSKEKIIN